MTDNDNDRPGGHPLWSSPDPHGQAAMLLVESLLHGLIARSTLSVRDAIDIVDTAIEVKTDLGGELRDTPDVLRKSLDILAAIGASLQTDLGRQ